MQNPIPYRVNPENLKFFNTTQGAFTFALLAHVAAVFLYWWFNIPEMVYFNVCISVPSFLFAISMNRMGYHNLAFSFAFLELFAHQLASVYFIGWDPGLQFWLFFLAGLCFFNPRWSLPVQIMLLLIIVAGYTVLFIFFQEGVYTLDTMVSNISYLLNALMAMAVLSLLINYFSKSTLRAEDKLIDEKEITDRQNIQLNAQRQSLVIEQDKTYRMLTKIESLFGQQVSKEVAQEMINSDTEIDSKIYDVSVMFLDIRDFTLFADSREPEEVARFQNIVFSELIDIVRENKGVVLQILGDGIMAVFGAPVVDKDHTMHSVIAGYAMIEKIKELGNSGKIPKIRIGIGLHSGKIMAGNVGNETRKFYSLTGTNVIIAARIEQLNKKYNSQFLVSESVYKVIKDQPVSIEGLGEIPLKGIEKNISIYKLG